ncbi:MAG TPA: helix-turn-helix domain-containing GNAT family N-acetyltransferase [Candidatus Baltobacteraceae bacterium]|jgi:DNA-binding MarR family transcriptional regulator/N-acetylglutamate synthase-like GNAT family acetyltransferase
MAAGDTRIAAVRGFNRFYTKKIGALRGSVLQSKFSLSEARVLYELAHRKTTTAVELSRDLGLDPGYLSRILQRFAARGLISRRRSSTDTRQTVLTLTPRGGEAFAPLARRQNAEVAAMLGEIPEGEQERAIAAMREIQTAFSAAAGSEPYIIREHQPGDIGWVISRHGALYAQEFGWDITFEAYVADTTARFIRELNPKRERCWIAERNGRNVACIFLFDKGDNVAQLRMLIVDPEARGLGIGHRLVDECIRFARQCRYAKMLLWTIDILSAARKIYKQAGFKLIESTKTRAFGHDHFDEWWELPLTK